MAEHDRGGAQAYLSYLKTHPKERDHLEHEVLEHIVRAGERKGFHFTAPDVLSALQGIDPTPLIWNKGGEER